jgi:hypothetical protein
MAYFIFLKYLRSLEEFRKILMSKFLLNLLVQISKALVNSKIQFLIQKFFFFVFGPANPTTHSAFGPAGPAGPSPLEGQSHLCRPKPLGPGASLAYLQKYVFFFDSRLPFSAPSLYPPADTWGPLISFVFSTTPTDPGRDFSAPALPAPPAPRLGCHRAFTAPSLITPPPLIPFEPSLNVP